MSTYVPGQFKQSLQRKIKGESALQEELPPLPIKKTDPTDFLPRASDFYKVSSEQRAVNSSTAVLPKESPLNKPVHERMKEFVKGQYGGK